MLSIKRFTFNHFATNCYVIYNEACQSCAIVDPTAETPTEEARLVQFIEQHQLKPEYVMLTHAHVDHIAGLQHICQRYNLPVTMHGDGVSLLQQAPAYGSLMGFSVSDLGSLSTNFVSGGDKLPLGDDFIECRYVPGHCPGSICYVLHDEQQVITGDALFNLSIGRTDLPGGDYDLLISKINEELLVLGDDFQILPGHGDDSTIGYELKYNSFLI